MEKNWRAVFSFQAEKVEKVRLTRGHNDKNDGGGGGGCGGGESMRKVARGL